VQTNGGRERWTRLGALIANFRDTMRERPVGLPPDRAKVLEQLSRYDFRQPLDLDDLTAEVAELFVHHSLHVTHPRYFGLFNPAVREAGIVGETLAATFNPQLAAWSHSPIANEMERHVLAALGSLLGLDPAATFANFATGGAEANLTAVVVALAQKFPRWSREGIAAIDARPRLYLSVDAHDSLLKAVRVCGLGTDCLSYLPARGPAFSLDAAELEQAIVRDRAQGLTPFMIVGTAGTTSTGAVDPLRGCAALAARERIWFHVDAAWAGAAALSPLLRGAVDGIEQADSVTWDAHKWLSVPFSAGMFFCRHPQAVCAAFAVSASYMPSATSDTYDPYATTLQWSRRAIGLKVFMALAELGLDGYRKLVERQAEIGAYLRQRLLAKGFEIANRGPLPLICFTHPEMASGRVSTGEVLRRLYARGRAWISEVRPNRGAALLRACITSYETDERDVDLLVDELLACMTSD
jgi:glutamate/tyrosine decarboxylase-like PLP-dependent enzyme